MSTTRRIKFFGLMPCLALLCFFCSRSVSQAGSQVIGWLGQGSPVVMTNIPADLTNVVAIAAGAGNYFGLALRSDGTVTSWGGSESNGPVGLSNVVAIAVSFFNCNLLLPDTASLSGSRLILFGGIFFVSVAQKLCL